VITVSPEELATAGGKKKPMAQFGIRRHLKVAGFDIPFDPRFPYAALHGHQARNSGQRCREAMSVP